MRRSAIDHPLIEPLESRIAPAALFATLYSDKVVTKTGQTIQFIHASDPSLTGSNLEIAKTVGQNAQVYFIKLTAGEDLQILTPVGFRDTVNVTSGTVVAFFTDRNSDGHVDIGSNATSNELTGISLGTKTSVAIGDGVVGDIVTNYNDLTGQITSGVSAQLYNNTVSSISVGGSVGGAIVSGGNVSRIFATGEVHEILTGTAANNYSFSFDPNVQAVTGTFAVGQPLTGVAGPSLSNVTVSSTTLIHLGDGGPNAVGGGINGLTLLNVNGRGLLDGSTGFSVIGGAGGAGKAGGSITNVLMEGPLLTEVVTTYNDQITLQGGAGGQGVGNGKGGAGGAVQHVFVDYQSLSAATSAQSAAYLTNNVAILGGSGGNGGTGGAGGGLSDIHVLTETLHDTVHTNAIEIQLKGGSGGGSPLSGKGGAGGSVVNSEVLNVAVPVIPAPTPADPSPLPNDTVANSATNAHILVAAGAGGSSPVNGAGGAGGSVSSLTLEGFNFEVDGGTGGSGTSSGGAGGGIGSVTVLGSVGVLPGDNFHAQSLVVKGGAGGSAAAGKGGSGGGISGITVQNSDFGSTHLDLTSFLQAQYGLQLLGGNGGTAGKGSGGAGGAVANARITDIDFLTQSHPNGNSGQVQIGSGNGGSSPVPSGKGGSGGAVSNVTLIGTRIAVPSITSGAGGSAGSLSGSGTGGAGGTISNVAVRSAEGSGPSTQSVTPGLLSDSSANFVNGGVQVGDTVVNELTFQQTTVTAVSQTSLTLAEDIFAGNDPYLVEANGNTNPLSGTSVASQFTLVDSTVNFVNEGVKVGDIVENFTSTAAYNNNVPVTAVVTSVSANSLGLSNDIMRDGDIYEIPTLDTVHFMAGSGGAGSLTGKGGAGGSINNSSANNTGPIQFNAGNGGAGGATAAAGAGGSLSQAGAFSSFASGKLYAGSAGATGGKAGAGGGISGATVQVLTDVTLAGGDGAVGGAGGSLVSNSFSGVLQSGAGFNPPSGDVFVKSGSGGLSPAGNGGAGGNITSLTGFVSNGQKFDPLGTNLYTTSFVAGHGGNGLNKAGGGGSVSNVRLFGGGGFNVTFFIDGGDAGAASGGKAGATGGSVTGVGAGAATSGVADPNFSIATGTRFHHISAGDGGNSPGKGGLGGSVSNVFVNATIGIRTGAQFGFDLAGAGGISAGAGGTGGTINGLSGNVSNIAADAIASIVAGHLKVGDALKSVNLANKVDQIILNGSNGPSLAHQFALTFGNETTPLLPTNATKFQVAAALNSLNGIQAAGGVTVVEIANGFQVTFNKTGAQATLSAAEPMTDTDGSAPYTTTLVVGTSQTPEQQNVQLLPNDAFMLTFEGQTTTVLPAGATPQQVQDALNALSTIGANGVTVTAGTAPGNPSYNIAFTSNGFQPNITGDLVATVSNVVSPASNQAVETVVLPARGDISPVGFSTAHFVGSIANLLQPNAAAFHYTATAGGTTFKFGDVPIDGLIAATTLTANKNFIPEAFVTIDGSGNAILTDYTAA